MEMNLVKKHLHDRYGIVTDEMTLHRDMIGKIFFVSQGHQRYAVKLYRPMYGENARQTARVLEYLRECDFPALRMYHTNTREYISSLAYEQEQWPCLVFSYIKGEEPDKRLEVSALGHQLALLHRSMKGYPGDLIKRQKHEYLDEYMDFMKQKGLRPSIIDELEQYGRELWERISHLPRYFCHGDFHTGNIIRTEDNKYVFLDYDDMSGDWPMMDVAYLSDGTHFNNFSDAMFEAVENQFEKVYAGYGKIFSIGEEEYRGIFDFIAVRHYQILARIIRCQGLECITLGTCHEQHDWLMGWNNLCQKKL